MPANDPPPLFQPSATATPYASPKQVVSNTLPLIERWRWSGTVFYPQGIIATEDLIIAKIQDSNSHRKVVVFDAHSGAHIWESKNIRNLESLHADEKRVYAGAITHVQAFDLETGAILWKGAEQPIDKKGFLYVYPKENLLEVYDFSQEQVYILNSQTGRSLEKIRYPFIFLKKDHVYYSGCCSSGYKTASLKAKDELSGQLLWSHNFGGRIHIWPTFTDSLIIVNAGGTLFAVDIETGDIRWQSPDSEFVAGVAMGGDLAYALKEDATIVALNPDTGEPIGSIEMSPARTIQDDVRYTRHYDIAASERFVAAYYGNSQELIVFEKVGRSVAD